MKTYISKEDIEKCVRCGTCRSICPTFRAEGREGGSARGKLSLIREHLAGGLAVTPEYIKRIKDCTLCGGCRDSCPNSVDTVGLIRAAREEIRDKEGGALSFLVRNVVESPRLMPLLMKAASKIQGLVFKDDEAGAGLLARFSLPVVGQGRLIPQLASTPFMELASTTALSGNPGGVKKSGTMRVAFFAGCGVNYLMPQVGTAAVAAVQRAGGEVVVPAGQGCCGMPLWASGDTEAARRMALKNVLAFEESGADHIVTACATCTHGLKDVFKQLLSGEGEEIRAKVESFTSKVMDVTQLLAAKLDPKAAVRDGKKVAEKIKVTYHDPCHLNRYLGVRDEPRELIRTAPGVELKEMRFPCSCCGLGGGLAMSNYELSIEVSRRKAESVRDSGASVVATACPGCIVQLKDAMHKYDVNAKVVHVVELL